MGTYDKPGTGNYLIDKSANALSKSIKNTITAFDTQMSNIEASKNALTKLRLQYKDDLTKATSIDDLSFNDSLFKMYNDLVDENYRIGYNSIGRDQTAYIENTRNIENSLDMLNKGLNLLNKEAETLNNALPNADTLISNSTDPSARAFVRNIAEKNGNQVVPYFKNGSIMLKFDGVGGDGKQRQYDLNLTNYVNSIENTGQGLIKYTNDPSETLKSIWDSYASKYSPKIKQWQEITDNGKNITTFSQKLYDEVNSGIMSDMQNDTRLVGELNEDSWQIVTNLPGNYIPGGKAETWTGSPDQIKRLTKGLIDYSRDRFGNESPITKEIVKPVPPPQPKKIINKNGKVVKDYSEIFIDEFNTAKNILTSDNPLETYAQYIRDQNPSNPPNLLVENDILYRIDFQGTGSDAKKIWKQLMSLEYLENIDLKKLIIQINQEKGKDNMIPTDRISEYLKKIKMKQDEEEPIDDDKTIIEDTKVPGATPTIEVPTTESEILDFDMKMLDDAVKNMSFLKYNYLRKIVDLPPIPDDVTFEKYKQSLEDAYYGRETDEELLKEQNKIIPVLMEQMKKFADRKRAQMDPKSVL